MKKPYLKILSFVLLGLGVLSCQEVIEPEIEEIDPAGIEIENPKGAIRYHAPIGYFRFIANDVNRVNMPDVSWRYRWELTYVSVRQTGPFESEHVGDNLYVAGWNQHRNIEIPYIYMPDDDRSGFNEIQEFRLSAVAIINEEQIQQYGDIVHELIIYYYTDPIITGFMGKAHDPATRKTRLIKANDISPNSGQFVSSLNMNFVPFDFPARGGYFIEHLVYPASNPPHSGLMVDPGMLGADAPPSGHSGGIIPNPGGPGDDPCLTGPCITPDPGTGPGFDPGF